MKKLISLVVLFLFLFNNFSYAGYDGYKAYLKGLLALKKGKIDVAVSEYERVLSYDENASSVYKDLALAYLQKGDSDKALESAKKLREAEKNDVDTQMFLASFFLSANDAASAKQCWERVLELDPKNETATVYLAAYYYSDNKLEDSVKYWTKFLRQQPESSEGYFQLGLAQERLGLYDKALKNYKKVNDIKPEAQEAYLARARIYENKKQFKLAIEEYKEYAKRFSGNPAILIYLGKCYYEEKNYEQAEEILLRAKASVPNNISLNYLLGMVYEKQLKFDEAVDVFEFIVKFEPVAANYTRLGYYYSLKHEYKTAEKNFNKALEKEPLNHEILYLSALNYFDFEKYDNARKNLEKAVYLKPDFNSAKFYLAVAYDKLGGFEKAEILIKEILEAEPDNSRALNFLGYGYADRNINLDEAEIMLKKAVKKHPYEPAYLDSLAWLYYKKQDYVLAEKYIVEAVNNQSKVYDKDLYEHLGDVSIETEKFSQAWMAYKFASDFGSETSEKKIKLLENKLSKKELAKLNAKRAVLNYKRISALKAGYKLKVHYGGVKTSSFLSVFFARQAGLKAELAPKFSFQGFTAFFNNGDVDFYPQAVKDTIDGDIMLMFDFANIILSKDFPEFLESCDFEFKGKNIIYKKDDFSVTVNSKDGMFKNFSKKDLFDLKIKSFKNFDKISKIPEKMIFKTKKTKFKAEVNINNLSVPSLEELNSFLKGNAD